MQNGLWRYAAAVLIGLLLVGLGWSCGHKSGSTSMANSVDSDRLTSEGRKILPGEPDERGITQAEVVPIEDPGLFGNHDVVKFTPPGSTKPVEVPLPVGVSHNEVASVAVVRPAITQVKVTGNPPPGPQPTITVDPITLVTDSEGRLYHSGANPLPYRVRVDGGTYSVVGTGKVDVVVARREEPSWGFRLRPKFWSGILPIEVLRQSKPLDAVDVGLALDVVHWKAWNLNLSAGVRSVGMDVGLDLTRNFGVSAGYRYTYSGIHTPMLGLYFGF